MSEHYHTEGPWNLKSDSSSGSAENITITGSDGQKVVAASRHAWDPEAVSKREFQDTMRLISAAPDMLAALEEIRDMVGGESADPDRDIARMQDIASNAIAKATGKGGA